jgi:hypothetical protein
MARSKGRTGRPWRRIAAQVRAATDICVICGHAGARTVDHDPPLRILETLGLDPRDPQYLRIAHGSGDARNPNPCPTCGQYCNQRKGSSLGYAPPAPSSRDW